MRDGIRNIGKVGIIKTCQLLGALFLALSAVAWVHAEGAGQEDLDKAMDVKLNATTISDLSEVIRLTESALKSGLDEANTEFANQILASTLMQRSQETVKLILSGVSSIADLQQKRLFAISDLEKAIAANPKLSDAYVMLAQLSMLPPEPNAEKAREAINKALEIGFEDSLAEAKALILRAELQTDAEKKLADLDAAVKLAPDSPDVVRTRGLFLADLDKLDAALADLNKVIELSPEDGPVYEAKALLLARMKRYDEALDVLEQARKLSPNSVVPLLQQARVHSTQENLAAALEDLNKALEIHPDNAAILLMRASIYQEQGEKDKAMTDVDKALESKPNLPVAIRTKALLLLERERYDEATKELERLYSIEPKDPLTMLQLAMLYGAQKKLDKAVEMYTKLMEAAPDEWRAYRGRGDIYLTTGRQAEAIADFGKALELQPKDQSVLNNLAWVLATSPDDKLRDGKRAIELATQACELTEYKAAYILSTLAAAYAETGDFDTAVKWSTKAVEVDEQGNAEALKKELESYKAKKPWRELLKNSDDEDAPDEQPKPADEKKADEPAKDAPKNPEGATIKR